jgi:hypothetical protein
MLAKARLKELKGKSMIGYTGALADLFNVTSLDALDADKEVRVSEAGVGGADAAAVPLGSTLDECVADGADPAAPPSGEGMAVRRPTSAGRRPERA